MKLILMLLSVVVISGCAAFQRPDGSVDPDKVQNAGAAAGTAVSTIIPPPLGLAIGGAATAIATAVATYLRGKERGWDEKAEDVKKSSTTT